MINKTILLPPVLLDKSHKKEIFDCGNEALNVFLKKYALQNSKNNASRTYVSICKSQERVVGYYTLTYGSISHLEATEIVKKHMPNYPIPIMVLARLAVCIEYKNLGLGKSLLKNAMLRTWQAASIAGLKAVIAHAKDDNARNFYLKYGFEESVFDQYHLMIPIQDIELIVKEQQG
jgi:predicted N-acetyltransferase YhbS